MFTVGLFSTHIPYIAFVAFYAVFFLFGIEKASAGDFGEGERLVPEVVSFTADNHPSAGNAFFDYTSYTPENSFKQVLLFERKTKFLFSEYTLIKITDYRHSWFSRPPPVA